MCIIPRAGYRMGYHQTVEALQWPAYVRQTRKNVTHTGSGKEVHLPGGASLENTCVKILTS